MSISTAKEEKWAPPEGHSAQFKQENKLIPQPSTGSPTLLPTETREGYISFYGDICLRKFSKENWMQKCFSGLLFLQVAFVPGKAPAM